MADLFDPYYVWLGIPADEQPANHYRLLGLRAFESNADVIDHAADRQMAHLRSFSTGERAVLAQRLLNEIAAARVCLLDAKAKADYDARLRAAMYRAAPPACAPRSACIPAAPTPPSAPPPQAIAVRAVSAPAPASTASSLPSPVIVGGLPRRRAKRSPLVAAIAVVAAVALAGWFVANAMNSQETDGDGAESHPSPVAANVSPAAGQRATAENKGAPTATPGGAQSTTAPAAGDGLPEALLEGPVDPPANTPPADTPSTNPPPTGESSPAAPSPQEPDPADSDASFESLLDGAANSPGAGRSADAPLAGSRLPLPDAAALAAKEDAIRALFRKQFAQTQPRDVTAFGRELLALARDTENDPLGRYATLKLAIEQAAKAGDSDTAQAAAEEIALRYEADRLDAVAEALLATAKGGVPTLARAALAERLHAATREAYAGDRLELATTLAAALVDAARNARLPSASKRAVALSDEIAAAQEHWPDVKAALATLAESPNDAAACSLVGKYRCFVKGDWERGLAYLALGDDEALKKLAAIELSRSPTPADLVAAGDGWWAVADALEPAEQQPIRTRALSWYVRANDALTGGLEKLRIEKRLAEAALGDLPDDAALVLTFESDTFSTRGAQLVATDRSGKRTSVAFHGAKPTDGRAGKALLFETASQFGDAGSPPLLKTPAELTVCAWIKPMPSVDGPAISRAKTIGAARPAGSCCERSRTRTSTLRWATTIGTRSFRPRRRKSACGSTRPAVMTRRRFGSFSTASWWPASRLSGRSSIRRGHYQSAAGRMPMTAGLWGRSTSWRFLRGHWARTRLRSCIVPARRGCGWRSELYRQPTGC